MAEQIEIIQQKDHHKTQLHCYLTEGRPVLSLLMLHGMAEHQARYQEFASFLNRHGIDFYIYNHRGHGPENHPLGFIARRNGHNVVVSDALTVSDYIQKHKRTEKFVLMGHSFGSVVARNVIQHKDDFDAAIFCGTTNPSYPVLYAGLALTSVVSLFRGPDCYSELINDIVFGGRDYQKICTRTEMDWISKSESNLDAYRADPLCGFTCTVSFFHDLISLAYFAKKPEYIGRTRRSLPVFFIAGAEDPVGGCGSQVEALVRQFKKLHFLNVTCRLYKEDRHEILNEEDRMTVMEDIVSWLGNTVSF